MIMDHIFGLFDKFAEVCKKLCYIALAVILLSVLSDRVRADVGDDFIMMGGDNQLMGAEVSIPAPAGVVVQAETDEVTGFTKVTIYIHTVWKDVQSKYFSGKSVEANDETIAPKAS